MVFGSYSHVCYLSDYGVAPPFPWLQHNTDESTLAGGEAVGCLWAGRDAGAGAVGILLNCIDSSPKVEMNIVFHTGKL